MSSSTSSSESPAWGRWLATFLAMAALGAGVIFALVMLVDPYDSGRFGLIGIKGISDESPRTANASRGRDPQFNAAVFGNSTGQLLKPAELSQATGARFVQLTVPGTGPREQIALLRWFVRHHPRAGCAGDRDRHRLVHGRSRLAGAQSISVLALFRQRPRISRAAVQFARTGAHGAASPDRARAANTERAGRLLGLRTARSRRIPARAAAERYARRGDGLSRHSTAGGLSWPASRTSRSCW